MMSRGFKGSASELGFVFSDDVYSKFGLRPLTDAFLSEVPVVAEPVSYHVSLLVDSGAGDGCPGVVEGLYFVPGLVVPEVNDAIGASSHEPPVVDRVEGRAVYGIQDGVSGLLVLVALEGDD